ncbi:MAG: ADP-ribosylglycohydrolase family protein [Candidatus Poribacteria bacterium]
MATLFEKIYGCISASHIGSSMGAAVEGWNKERIYEKYGILDKLLPYEHYGNKWIRPPGTTEDGIERQKLMLTAIIEKKDRVTAEDVVKIWLRDIKPESDGMVSEPFEKVLLSMARAGIPAQHIGRYCPWDGLVSMARSCHGIGIINACDPDGASRDIYDVGLLYQTHVGDGLKWAEIVAVGIAYALRSDATVDSVIETVIRYAHPRIIGELKRGLDIASKYDNVFDMRDDFYKIYNGTGIAYAQSWANEVVTKAFAVFKVTNGNASDAIIGAVNFGRDTDCLAAIAGGLAGALSGIETIRQEWIEQVDYAVKLNKYTNSQRTLKETAEGLYQAVLARVEKAKNWINLIELSSGGK